MTEEVSATPHRSYYGRWKPQRRPYWARGRSRDLAIALSVILLGATVGCSTPDESASPTACAAVPGVTDDTINLGMILSDTGTAASQAIGARAGADARFSSQNEAGGVHGRKIVYDLRDDQSDQGENLAAAKNLVEKEGVFGVFSATSVSTGSAEYLHSARVPVFGLAMEAAWGTYDNMVSYLNRFPSSVVFDTLGKFAKAKGVQRAVILTTGTSVASVAGAGRITSILQHSGIEVVGTVDYAPALTTPATIGRQIARTGADALFAPVTGDDFIDAYQGAMAAGADLKVGLGVSGYGHELLARKGAKMAGAYFYVAYLPFEADTVAQQTYLDAIARYAPELDPPDAQAAIESYITADLLIEGLQAVGPCPTRQGVLTALRSISDYDGAGLLPAPVDLTQGFGQSARCLTFVRVNAVGTGFDVEQPSVCGDQIAGGTS
ncbi:ABC-type branched-chain amino acid transport systems periplasmic component-like protein [Parafrankia sp. EUN1f]|nr:ABC-type branched-chain amino acid transport systems periplasmic component-like protein [Parafrankia sp. EUN1f]